MKFTVKRSQRVTAASMPKSPILGAEGDEDASIIDDSNDLFVPVNDFGPASGSKKKIDDDNAEDMIDPEEIDEDTEEVEIQEEQPHIDTDNNISGHFIAECSVCKGIFISAVTESDQKIELISGTCPLCEKETDQYLKWVIHDVEGA